jgi:hypothetical protein
MTSSVHVKLADPEEYQSSIGDSEDLKCIVTAPGEYRADLTFIDFDTVKLQRGTISLPRIVSSAHTNDLCNFCFPTAPQPPSLFNGVEVPEYSIGIYAPAPNISPNRPANVFGAAFPCPARRWPRPHGPWSDVR